MLPLGQILTMTLSGRLVTRYGSKCMLQIASICYALILCTIAFVNNVWMLGLTLFFFGVFSNMGNIAVNTQGVAIENLYKRPLMSSFHGTWSLAGFIAALIGLAMSQMNLYIYIHFFSILTLIIINWVVKKLPYGGCCST